MTEITIRPESAHVNEPSNIYRTEHVGDSIAEAERRRQQQHVQAYYRLVAIAANRPLTTDEADQLIETTTALGSSTRHFRGDVQSLLDDLADERAVRTWNGEPAYRRLKDLCKELDRRLRVEPHPLKLELEAARRELRPLHEQRQRAVEAEARLRSRAGHPVTVERWKLCGLDRLADPPTIATKPVKTTKAKQAKSKEPDE